MARRPAVAGAFYPGLKNELSKQLDSLFSGVRVSASKSPIAFVCPHAGYIYSGKTAAFSYSRMRNAGKGTTFIIIGPNHQGTGPEISIYPEGEWETPLGNARIDSDLACRIFDSKIAMDVTAHHFEHSIEVQLPFLQHLFGPDISFVPICMLNQSLAVAQEVGLSVAKAIKATKKKAIVIASSDLSHYIPKTVAERKDRLAIDAILSMNPEKAYETIMQNRISACGYGPIVATMTAAKALGAKKSRLLHYTTSAEATGDDVAVVGYAAIEFSK